MTDTILSEVVRPGLRVRVEPDLDSSHADPRDHDNFSHFFTAHRRLSSPDDYSGTMTTAIAEVVWPDGNLPKAVEEAVEADDLWALMALIGDRAVWLKVFLLDHSSRTYRAAKAPGLAGVNPFSCPWDSGMAGIILITKEAARDVQMVKRLSPAARARTLSNLAGEVDEWSDWADGNVHGYIVEELVDMPEDDEALDPDDLAMAREDWEEDDANWTEVDACWGIVGDASEALAMGIEAAPHA